MVKKVFLGQLFDSLATTNRGDRSHKNRKMDFTIVFFCGIDSSLFTGHMVTLVEPLAPIDYEDVVGNRVDWFRYPPPATFHIPLMFCCGFVWFNV